MPFVEAQPNPFVRLLTNRSPASNEAVPAGSRISALPSPDDPNSHSTCRPVLIFSDFDGTIMLGDTGHVLFDRYGCGERRRKELDNAIHRGELSFRNASEQMWDSLYISLEDGLKVMKEQLTIDPDFTEFHKFCVKNEIPFNIISAGIKPVLRHVLDEFVGEQSRNIGIVANDVHVEIAEDGHRWRIIWRDNTNFGHDKAASIQEARAQVAGCGNDQPPMIIFIGDGVSDLPAARECDMLFARRGLRLEEYCIEHNIAYIPFDTFKDIEREVCRIIEDDRRVKRESISRKSSSSRRKFWRTIPNTKSIPSLTSFVRFSSQNDISRLRKRSFMPSARHLHSRSQSVAGG